MKWFFRYINDEDGVDVTKTGEHKAKKSDDKPKEMSGKSSKKLTKK